MASVVLFGPLEAAGNPDGKDSSMMCLKCKSAEIVYECDPCGCPSFCRKCAMKVASGAGVACAKAWLRSEATQEVSGDHHVERRS